MVKRALTLLTSILIALHMLMPFNIYADTITNSNVLGINTVLLSKSQNVAVTNSWYYVYQHTITLDADYIGTITLDINLTYYSPSGSSSQTIVSSINNKTYFVNGNTITINQIVTSDNYGNQGPIVSSSYLLKSSNVIKTSTITELQQIIDLLTSIYNSEDQVEGLLNNQLEQLELCVQNTSLANQYLKLISEFRQYHYPIESYSFIYYLFSNVSNNRYDVINYNNYYDFPVFRILQNTRIFSIYPVAGNNYETVVVFGTNQNIIKANFSNYFNTNGNLLDVRDLNIKIGNFKFIKVNLSKDDNNDLVLTYINSNQMLFVPVYLNNTLYKNVSTEFALQFGLTNRYLDNIDIIANGTTASQSAAQSSDSANSQLQTDSNTLFEQENDFKSDMQSAMQNVNNTFRLQDMGQKFVSSAQWVRTQYEQLTNNTPFASLITFSLITGLALILLGKIYK